MNDSQGESNTRKRGLRTVYTWQTVFIVYNRGPAHTLSIRTRRVRKNDTIGYVFILIRTRIRKEEYVDSLIMKDVVPKTLWSRTWRHHTLTLPFKVVRATWTIEVSYHTNLLCYSTENHISDEKLSDSADWMMPISVNLVTNDSAYRMWVPSHLRRWNRKAIT